MVMRWTTWNTGPGAFQEHPPDGPKPTENQATEWAQMVRHYVQLGQWGEVASSLRLHLETLASQGSREVSLDRPWPQGFRGPPVQDPLRIHAACERCMLHLRRGQYWLAARALADQAAIEQEQADLEARHAELVARLGHLPPDEIQIVDLVTDPHVMESLDRRGIVSVSELVSRPTEWLHRSGITRARLQGLVADLDRHHVRHSFTTAPPSPKHVTQHQRKLLAKDRRAGKAALAKTPAPTPAPHVTP